MRYHIWFSGFDFCISSIFYFQSITSMQSETEPYKKSSSPSSFNPILPNLSSLWVGTHLLGCFGASQTLLKSLPIQSNLFRNLSFELSGRIEQISPSFLTQFGLPTNYRLSSFIQRVFIEIF